MTEIDRFPIKRRRVAQLVNQAYRFGYFAPEEGTQEELEEWRISHVEEITDKIMTVTNLKKVERLAVENKEETL